ncbi:MAG: YcaO-like family protein [Actinomycetota bacterium]|nr:YcaO-like family protein [Actinomycetota bacterium]
MKSLGGTYRECAPEQTWHRIQPYLAEYGITRVADVTDLDVIGIPVFAAMRPTAMTLTCSQGKGITRELARVSAVMENLETAVAEEYRPERMPWASFAEIAPSYGTKDLSLGWPSALTEHTKLAWCDAVGILDRSAALVPHAVVSMYQESAAPWYPALFARASNGLASGNTLAEAALHALWELVERECTLRLSRTPLADRRYLDPWSVTDSVCAQLIEAILAADFQLEIIDASSGPWPVFAVYVYNSDMADVFGGGGAHADPAVALSRALTEAVQSRLSTISGLRDDIPSDTYRERRVLVDLNVVTDARLHNWDEIAGREPHVDASLSALEQLQQLAVQVAAVTGHQPLLADLSPAHGDFHVCRVIGPGLRHDSRGKFARPVSLPEVS